MTNQTINRIAVIFGFFVALFSSLTALASGGDLVFVIAERFFVVLAAGAFLAWSALTIVNSIVIGAAKTSLARELADIAEAEMSKVPDADNAAAVAEAFRQAHENSTKGTNLDLTSEPQEDVFSMEQLLNSEQPEIKEFEPFKPKRIESDRDTNTQ